MHLRYKYMTAERMNKKKIMLKCFSLGKHLPTSQTDTEFL